MSFDGEMDRFEATPGDGPSPDGRESGFPERPAVSPAENRAAAQFRRAYLHDPEHWKRPVRWVWILAALYVLIWLVPVLLDSIASRRGGGFELEVVSALAHDPVRVWNGEWWLLLSGTFLHGNFVHLLFNLLGLVLLGPALERWLRPTRFLLYYFLTALLGALFFQAAPGVEPGVGASGGILGLLGIFSVGVYARPGRGGPVLPPRFWFFVLFSLPILFLEGPFGALIFSALGYPGIGVAVSAHVGGFLAGILLGLWYVYRRSAQKAAPEDARARNLRRSRLALGSFAAILGIAGAYGLFFPVGNWGWYVARARDAIERRPHPGEVDELISTAIRLGGEEASPAVVLMFADAGDLSSAFRYWKTLPADYRTRSRIGFEVLHDDFWSLGRYEDADKVLDELIGLADAELARDRSPELLNEAAWYRAERKVDLDRALAYATEAFERLPEPTIQNTLGWVQVRRGDWEAGVENLKEAAEQQQIGSHFLYLALAFLEHGDDKTARAYARRTRFEGLTTAHERALLDMVEKRLGIG